MSSDGVGDAGKGILLDASGLIDIDLLGLHASAHEVGGADLIDHDSLTGFVANEHIDWTGASSNLITSGIVRTDNVDLYDTDKSNFLRLDWNEDDSADRTLAILVSGAGRNFSLGGNLTVEADSYLNQNLRTTDSPTFVDLTVSTPSNIYNLSHDSFADFVANEHIDYTAAIDNTNKCVKCDTRVHAWLGTTMTNLTDNAWTLVQFDTEIFDTGGDFNTSTYLFTAPVTGYYFITTTIGFTNIIADKVYDAKLEKNSSTLITSANSANGAITSQVGVVLSGIFYLTAADTVGVKARPRCGASTVDVLGGASGYTNICIILLAT
jgi:hypothetical protein